MINKNIYEINLEKIKDFLEKKDPISALEIIEEELSMPYTPQEYLQEFLNYKKTAIYEINLSKNSRPISKQEVLDMIETKDKNKIIEAINLLGSIKITEEDLIIINPVFDSNIPRIFKCLLLENLIENRISLTINYMGHSLKPSELKSFRDLNVFNQSVKKIQDLTIKEPFLQNVSFDLLIYYFMCEFPFNISDDSDLISKSCVDYSKKMHGLSDFIPNNITESIDIIIKELQEV
jgi:hypothetical protein